MHVLLTTSTGIECDDSGCVQESNLPTRGILFNQLLVTLMQAMGVSASEWMVNGTPGFGDYGPKSDLLYKNYDRNAGISELMT